jgi:hypothetical protein
MSPPDEVVFVSAPPRDFAGTCHPLQAFVEAAPSVRDLFWLFGVGDEVGSFVVPAREAEHPLKRNVRRGLGLFD